MRVLFLTRYPESGASSRYRVFQYIPHLEALGVDCTVQPFMDERLYRLSQSPGQTARKTAATLGAILRRLAYIRAARTYDLVYLQRELLPLGPPLFERWLSRQSAPVVFDLDDALFLHKPSRYSPLAGAVRSSRKVVDLFRMVSCVVAGNDWLRDRARAEGARAVTLEVAEDTQRIPMHAPHSNARPVTIGWLGSPTTVKYLTLLSPVLRGIAADHPEIRFEIMGGGDFAMEGVPWRRTDWSLRGELDALARFDIGLMPLPNEDWALGKSGGKARTYMAAGVVPVCARVGYNTQLITPGETGFLCDTVQEWDQALRCLIADPGLRQNVAQRARHAVETRFDPAVQAGRLRALFDTLVTGREVAL